MKNHYNTNKNYEFVIEPQGKRVASNFCSLCSPCRGGTNTSGAEGNCSFCFLRYSKVQKTNTKLKESFWKTTTSSYCRKDVFLSFLLTFSVFSVNFTPLFYHFRTGVSKLGNSGYFNEISCESDRKVIVK
jgi:hypothetical protein